MQANADAQSAGPDVPWATGGTKSMQNNYPDPFMTGTAGMACVLYPAQTIGPCYAQMPLTRADISDGLDGLPVRLSFLVVRSSGCMPVPDASIDVWHSGSQGIYSAYATGTICNPSTQDVKSKTFCRGMQSTDANGRVDFNTVFPGWYTMRTIHIHFTVRLNGQGAVTSQLYFDDALSNEILAQGTYKARGSRDTTNATDPFFRSGGATADQVLFSTAKRPDGGLHAWKVLSIG
jgi:protocatechuate 3,4-dioxygenase beta subunit